MAAQLDEGDLVAWGFSIVTFDDELELWLFDSSFLTLIEVESLGLGRLILTDILLVFIDRYPKSSITFALSFDDCFLAVLVY